MLALVLAMIFCVAIGAGVVGYVMVEARREGRGEFWTAEGEELIAGARRTGEKVRTRGERLGRTAAERTKDLAARLPEVGAGRGTEGEGSAPAPPSAPAGRDDADRAAGTTAPQGPDATRRDVTRRGVTRREDGDRDDSDRDGYRAAS